MGGIAEAVLSTFDIDRAAAALIAVGRYRRVDLPDASPGRLAAWRVPEACTHASQALLLPPIGERGALRLICFHGVDRQVIRPSQRTWDTGGIFDLDLFVTDVRGVYAELQRMGWSAFGEPVDYVMGEFDVAQVVATGPDGLVLALIQPHKPPSFDLPYDPISRIFNSTQMVRDMDAALAFYCDTLGWSPVMDMVVEGCVEPGADVLGLPMPFAKDAKRRVAIVHPQGVNDGSVELMQILGWQGRDNADRAVAPNVGLLALRFPVASVEPYAAEVVARGGALHAGPSLVDDVMIFSIRAPDGAILEFYEQQGDGNDA